MVTNLDLTKALKKRLALKPGDIIETVWAENHRPLMAVWILVARYDSSSPYARTYEKICVHGKDFTEEMWAQFEVCELGHRKMYNAVSAAVDK